MRTLVLDIGGVLYASRRPDATWWAHWADRCSMPPDELARRFWDEAGDQRVLVGAITAEDYYALSAARLGVPVETVRAMIRELFVSDPNHTLADFVRRLRSSGVPVSALTNSWSSEAELKARPELAGLFDRIISSADVGAAKPDEAIFRIAETELGLAAPDLVFVDDTAANVDVARALGWTAIPFVDTHQLITDLNRIFAA